MNSIKIAAQATAGRSVVSTLTAADCAFAAAGSVNGDIRGRRAAAGATAVTAAAPQATAAKAVLGHAPASHAWSPPI